MVSYVLSFLLTKILGPVLTTEELYKTERKTDHAKMQT